MAQLILLFVAAFTISACTKSSPIKNSTHKVSFEVELESNDGQRPFKIECVKYDDFKAYEKDQMAALSSGKAPTLPKPQTYQFATPGKPESKLTAVMELPEDKIMCGTDRSTINVHLGAEQSPVFTPKADTTIKVSYNMFARKMYKADSSGAKVELFKVSP